MVHKKIGISKSFGKPKSIIFTLLVFSLALLVACGSAAQPQVEQQAPAKETPKDVVVEKQAPEKSAPKVEKQAPKVEKPAPKVEKAAPIVVPPTIVPGAVSRPVDAPAGASTTHRRTSGDSRPCTQKRRTSPRHASAGVGPDGPLGWRGIFR